MGQNMEKDEFYKRKSRQKKKRKQWQESEQTEAQSRPRRGLCERSTSTFGTEQRKN